MAPNLSYELLASLKANSRVLDPMCGSGTVVRQAVEAGHRCVGCDIDPLAVLMARAWTSNVPTFRLVHDAHELVRRAEALSDTDAAVPWSDDATDEFARYWFGPDQLDQLARLAATLKACRYRSRDLLRICFSRLIITKDRGASLARDVSHSRPHRVTDTNDFDGYDGLIRAARLVAARLEPHLLVGTAEVGLGDARRIDEHVDGKFDAVMTSPPYLNAIDYLRGHRLTLIWFGHSIDDLQRVRSCSTGAERALDSSPIHDLDVFIEETSAKPFADRYRGWVRRYASDTAEMLIGMRSVLKPGGRIMLVVGNSMIRGASIDNAGIVVRCGEDAGLDLSSVRERAIPPRRRYLPPPQAGSPLAQRMRSESVITLRRPVAA